MTAPTKPINERLAGLRQKIATALHSLEDAVTAADALGIHCEEADMLETWAMRAEAKNAISHLKTIKGLPERTEPK